MVELCGGSCATRASALVPEMSQGKVAQASVTASFGEALVPQAAEQNQTGGGQVERHGNHVQLFRMLDGQVHDDLVHGDAQDQVEKKRFPVVVRDEEKLALSQRPANQQQRETMLLVL
eukprot:scpid106960/ scgid6966/ 